MPDTRRGNPAWEPGVRSPNVAGRPKGIIDKRHVLAQEMAKQGKAVVERVCEEAIKGDMAAAALVLSRLCPTVKASATTVKFALDTTKPLAVQAAQVVQSVADGDLPPESAQIVLNCLGTYAALVQADDVQARLAALERAAAGSTNGGARGGVLEMEKMQ